jgi:hypothetical protein
MRVAALLGVMVLASACAESDRRLPNATQPSTVPAPAPPPPPADRVISIGEKVEDTLIGHGTHKVYELTAPLDGVLVAQLSWDTKQGHLELWLEDTQFARSSSPTVGRLYVSAGRKYRVRVFDSAPWDYDDLFVPFVLATSIEQGE